jgi:hypothetical protein
MITQPANPEAVIVLLLLLVVGDSNYAQQSTPPKPAVPVDPITAVVDGFRSYSVVALSEGAHGNEQGLAFRLALIRDRRFAQRVNDILLEGPNARYQGVMDRYVRGEEVPLDSLRRVWDDSTQQQAGGPMWTGEVPAFYRAVRQLNASLPPEHQLRILLGDPPIDWDQVQTRDDFTKWLALRDTFPADLIKREVLAKDRRALVVFGNMHLQRKQLAANYEGPADGPAATVVSALEQSGATKVFSIWTDTDSVLTQLQPDVSAWPIPSLTMVRDTVLGAPDFVNYYPVGRYPMAANRMEVRNGKILGPVPPDQWRSLKMEDQFDAVLYLGPRSSITVPQSRPSADVCADPALLEKRLARAALIGMPQVEVDRLKQLCSEPPK